MLKLTNIVMAEIRVYLFISLKEVLHRFCKVVFFIDKNEKDNIIIMSR